MTARSEFWRKMQDSFALDRANDFQRIGAKPLRRKTRHSSKPSATMFRKLSKLFPWRRSGKQKDLGVTSTPESTALIDLDDLSLCNDSYVFESRDSDLNAEEVSWSDGEMFPYWEDQSKNETASKRLIPSRLSETKTVDESNTLRRSLMTVLKKVRTSSTISTTYSPSATKCDMEDNLNNDSDNNSDDHFSTSTDLRSYATPAPCVNICVMEGNGSPQKTPPIVSQTFLSSQGDEYSRISLNHCMQEQEREEVSLVTGPVALAEIDGASVVSVCLEVAYDNDYPQLILTPSYDETMTSRMTGSSSTAHDSKSLGATDTHPGASANRQRLESYDTTKKTPFCTPRWWNESIDKVWKQIDKNKTNSGDCDKKCFKPSSRQTDFVYGFSSAEGLVDRTDEITDEGSFEDILEIFEDTVGVDIDDRNDNRVDAEEREQDDFVCQQEGFTWPWSFSAEEHTISFTELIEKDIIHPILTPICHFVDATEIPDTVLCGSKCHRRRCPPEQMRPSSYPA